MEEVTLMLNTAMTERVCMTSFRRHGNKRFTVDRLVARSFMSWILSVYCVLHADDLSWFAICTRYVVCYLRD